MSLVVSKFTAFPAELLLKVEEENFKYLEKSEFQTRLSFLRCPLRRTSSLLYYNWPVSEWRLDSRLPHPQVSRFAPNLWGIGKGRRRKIQQTRLAVPARRVIIINISKYNHLLLVFISHRPPPLSTDRGKIEYQRGRLLAVLLDFWWGSCLSSWLSSMTSIGAEVESKNSSQYLLLFWLRTPWQER